MKKLSILILSSLSVLGHGSLWAEEGVKPVAEDKVVLIADTLKAKGAELYTCPMHPEVRQDKEAKCPVCGMDLKKVTGQEGSEN